MPRTLTRMTQPTAVKTATDNRNDRYQQGQLEIEEQIQESAEQIQESPEDDQDKGRLTNPYMRVITPEMIESPYPLDFAHGMNSYDFAMEKTSRDIIKRGGFDKQAWLEFTEKAWEWREAEELRIAEAEFAELLNKYEGNPKVYERWEEQMQAIA